MTKAEITVIVIMIVGVVLAVLGGWALVKWLSSHTVEIGAIP